jgi:hypothetical protein
VYWRLVGVGANGVAELRNWGAWLTLELRAHVVALTHGVRLSWLRRVAERLLTTKRILLSDQSPLFVDAVAADSETDFLTVGQIRVQATMGVLAPEPVAPRVNQAPVKLRTRYTAGVGVPFTP